MLHVLWQKHELGIGGRKRLVCSQLSRGGESSVHLLSKEESIMGTQLVFRFERDKWLIKVSTESVALCRGNTRVVEIINQMRCDRANQDGQLHLDIRQTMFMCICIFLNLQMLICIPLADVIDCSHTTCHTPILLTPKSQN
jgi:hypothetical protein